MAGSYVLPQVRVFQEFAETPFEAFPVMIPSIAVSPRRARARL